MRINVSSNVVSYTSPTKTTPSFIPTEKFKEAVKTKEGYEELKSKGFTQKEVIETIKKIDSKTDVKSLKGILDNFDGVQLNPSDVAEVGSVAKSLIKKPVKTEKQEILDEPVSKPKAISEKPSPVLELESSKAMPKTQAKVVQQIVPKKEVLPTTTPQKLQKVVVPVSPTVKRKTRTLDVSLVDALTVKKVPDLQRIVTKYESQLSIDCPTRRKNIIKYNILDKQDKAFFGDPNNSVNISGQSVRATEVLDKLREKPVAFYTRVPLSVFGNIIDKGLLSQGKLMQYGINGKADNNDTKVGAGAAGAYYRMVVPNSSNPIETTRVGGGDDSVICVLKKSSAFDGGFFSVSDMDLKGGLPIAQSSLDPKVRIQDRISSLETMIQKGQSGSVLSSGNEALIYGAHKTQDMAFIFVKNESDKTLIEDKLKEKGAFREGLVQVISSSTTSIEDLLNVEKKEIELK